MMTIKVTYSDTKDPASAVADIARSFSGLHPAAVVFFASSHYEPASLSASMKSAFPGATVFGCSTAGEIVSGKMLKGSVVAMAIESSELEGIHAGVIDLRDPESPSRVINGLARTFGSEPIGLPSDSYIGIILIDGLSCAEERVMDRIGNLTDIPVIGGSAGDDLAFQKTWVYLDGNVYTNSAVFALLKPGCKFDIIKTQSFSSMDKTLIPTSVNEASRSVLEFNGKPATTAYAEALGIKEEDIGSRFMTNPVGLMAGDEPFVRSPRCVEGHAISFYCQINKDVSLDLLRSTNIIEDTEAAIRKMEKEKGKLRGLINFNCILRTLQIEAEKKEDAYGTIFKSIPTIGFSTYGEEYIGHINQTATMLVFY